jgi:DNA-binding NarL/FixJ family response regulator
VASLVAKGLRNKAIAHYLGIGEGTVKIHLHNVYRKLRIKNRLQLVMHEAHKQ